MNLKNTAFLYVEDDAMSRQVMYLLLQRGLGVETLHMMEDTANFEERLAQLSPPPQIFLLDIHIKPLDGFEILRKLRQIPQFQHQPIIAVTASVMNEEIRRLKEVGFNGAIAKPIDQFSFPDLLERILKGDSVWYIT